MSLSIVNNSASLNAQQSLGRTSGALNKSLERLSSGLKVNRGADGPAALVISEQQRAQIAGLRTAIDNTNKAVSVVQTGEGALNEVNSLLTKIRGLALDSANAGVNDSNALAANQAEITNALQSIDRIANNTQFGTKKLLDGSAGFNAISSNTAVSGLNSTASTAVGTFTVDITQAAQKGQVSVAAGGNDLTALNNVNNLGADETLTFNGTVNVSLKAGSTNTQVRDAINAQTAQTGVVASIDSVAGNLVLTAKNFGQNFTVVSDRVGAAAGATGIDITTSNTAAVPAGLVSLRGQNLTATITNPDASTTNVTGQGNVVSISAGQGNGLSFTVNASPSNAAVSDAAADGALITTQDGKLTFQIGANAGQTADLAIAKTTTDALGLNQANNQFSSLKQIDITTTKGAQDALAVIDKSISDISNLRGTLGAFQANTLESTARTLRTSLENTTAAESVIRDTDFASEIANFTRLQTQQQAGSTVLGNANQTTQLVAQLLRG